MKGFQNCFLVHLFVLESVGEKRETDRDRQREEPANRASGLLIVCILLV